MAKKDLAAVLPEKVAVIYPRADNGTLGTTVHVVNVTLLSLALPEFAGIVGFLGTKPIHSSVIANFTGGGNPANNTELNTLATQVATDYYRYAASKLDIKYAGIIPWAIEGLNDVEWILHKEEVSTRIQRQEFNDLAFELFQAGQFGSAITMTGGTSITTIFQGPVTFNSTVIFNGTVIIQNQFQFSKTSVSLGGTQHDYALPNFVIVKVTTTSAVTFTGFSGGTQGRALVVENDKDSLQDLTFAHENAGSAASNRIFCYFGANFTLKPGQCMLAFYNTDESRWYVNLEPPLLRDHGNPTFSAIISTVYHDLDTHNVWININGGTSWQIIGGPGLSVPGTDWHHWRPNFVNPPGTYHFAGSPFGFQFADSGGPGADKVVAVPLLVTRNCTADRICTRAGPAGLTGTKLKLGFYENLDTAGAQFYPGTRLHDGAEITLDGTDKLWEETISIQLSPTKLYWGAIFFLDNNAAVYSSGAVPTGFALSANCPGNPTGVGSPVGQVGFTISDTETYPTGSLPNPFPTGKGFDPAFYVPLIGLRLTG